MAQNAEDGPDPTGHPAAPKPRGTGDPPATTSEALLGGSRELVIRHGAEAYRLRLTGNNKLILTK